MMTGVFQSVKQEDTKLFQVSVPDFRYEYKEMEKIAGHEVYHLGEGVYIFRDLIGLKECEELDLIEIYPDLQFIAYGPQPYVRNGNQWDLPKREGEDYKVLLFVASKKYTRHDINSIMYVLLHEAERFFIPIKYQGIIQEFIKQIHRAREATYIYENERVVYEPLEWLLSRDEYYLDRKAHEQGSWKQITGKLGFSYEPDKYEKVNGWDPYILCEGHIGRYVYPGIYHFEDSLQLPPQEINYESKMNMYPLLNDSSLGDTWFCCLGVEEWSGGSVRECIGIRARYICLDRQSEPVLRQMSEFLTDYKFGVKKQAKPIAPVIIDEKFIAELDKNCDDRQKKRNEKAAEYVIEDNAVELVAGYGFRNLTVLGILIFGRGLSHGKYDLAYVLGDDLILVDFLKGRLEVPLKAISTLKVKMVCDLGAGISENAVVTVLSRGESQKREFLGDEAYEKYIRYIEAKDKW